MATEGNQPEQPGGTEPESEQTSVGAEDQGASSTADAAPAASNSTEELLNQAEAKLAEALDVDGSTAAMAAPGDNAAAAQPFDFEVFSQPHSAGEGILPLSALQDVELDIRIELGRTELMLEDVVKLKEGSVVPLDKLAGDPVDILVNGRLIARGEVLVLNDNFCVRVAEILSPEN